MRKRERCVNQRLCRNGKVRHLSLALPRAGIFMRQETGYYPREIDTSWLARYEGRPDSIFKYYSIENEVQFLKQAEKIPDEEKVYYLEENVKRFLGEFVGKVPYTTIPYSLKPDGFDYAGMHMMDSYTKAASLGNDREKAETEGFGKIEEVFKRTYWDKQPTAVWISPPKDADYGFMFVLAPQQNGKVKEYILRYDEKRGSLRKSQQIAQDIGVLPPLEFNTAETFLRTPLFISPSQPEDSLRLLLKSVGIDQHKIQQSMMFEKEIEVYLTSWISVYTSLMLTLTRIPPNTFDYLDKTRQAEAILLIIYLYAQKIKTKTYSFSPFSNEHMQYAYQQIQQNSPLVEGGGSCPVVENHNHTLPGDVKETYISNTDLINAILKGTPLEKYASEEKSNSFPCPKCGRPIPSGEGRTSCPHCGVTKEQYAREVGGQTCA